MPPIPPSVIIGGGLVVAGVAAYIIYKAHQASEHAHEQEKAKEELQTLPE